MISPLIRWEHSSDWMLPICSEIDWIKSGVRSYQITLEHNEHHYIAGHVVDGRTLFPATGYLVSVKLTLTIPLYALFLNACVC